MAIRGWVYVITNKSMPGLVKIGYSTKDPELRATELGTGSPLPYCVEYDVLVEDPQSIEQRLHAIFANRREGKEWFRCDVGDAVSEIRNVVGKGAITEKINNQVQGKTSSYAAYNPHNASNRAYSIAKIKEELEQIAKERKKKEGE